MKNYILISAVVTLSSCVTAPNSPQDNAVNQAIRSCSVGASFTNKAGFDAKLSELLTKGNGQLSLSSQSELKGSFLQIPGMTPENFAPLYKEYLGCIDKRLMTNGYNRGQSIIIGENADVGTIIQTQ